jgi:ubiquinol-cytochrome c reductase cytochrome b subunit
MAKIANTKLAKMLYSHAITYGTPINLNWIWSFGSMAGFLLILQMVSGFLVACHYVSDAKIAFIAVEEIMTNIQHGWFLRYLHCNGASAFFIIVYLHIAKGLFYGSYFKPRHFLWFSGVLIFILMMATAFIGYVLPWGQMSLWGATVITSLFSVIPFISKSLLYSIWGGFTVSNPTLQRFSGIHYMLPFVIAGLAWVHLMLLHTAGSTNPTGAERTRIFNFFPSFGIKDVVAGCVTLVFLTALLAMHPNVFGHPDNEIPANIYVTPTHIVPEWYFLPFYAILRSIPHKTGGVLAMFFSLVVLFFLPLLNTSRLRSSFFRPYYSIYLLIFFIDLIFLGWIGQLPVESPYINLGSIGTLYYFAFFLYLVPHSAEQEEKMNYYKTPDIQKWLDV